jgi:sec-independent protein translocase protein TatC
VQDVTPHSPPAAPGEPKRDGQEEIDASKAPLIEHLVELRQRLIYSVAGFLAAFIICFAFSKQIYNILAWPYISMVPPDKPIKLIATGLLEQLFTQIKVAMFGGACIAFPLVANQIYKFVAPGLYRNEREAFWPYLVATPVFFTLGSLVVYFLAVPMIVRFSFANMEGTDAELMLRVSEYLSLVMTLIFGFGLCFQLPVIITLLARAGFVTSDSLRQFRRYAVVGICAVAAVLTPPDPLSMLALMVPTVALYELAIYAVIYLIEKPRDAKLAKEGGS